MSAASTPEVERTVGFRDPAALDVPWPDDATRDRLVGDWWFYQRRGGHRTSTDDLVTAYSAARHGCASPARYADIGCGIGSVLLTTAYALRPGESLGVEAQEQSAAMAARSIAELPDDAPPIRVLRGDLRDAKPETLGRFDLITGSPPYLPLGTGSLSPDPQRQRALQAAAASRPTQRPPRCSPRRTHLVFQTQWNPRVEDALTQAGLTAFATDFAMRTGRAPFLSVFAARRGPARAEVAVERIDVRDADGERTAAYQAVRERVGHARD